MPASTVVARLGLAAYWIAVALAICGLVFRSLLWSSWIPAPNEPYGAADILELIGWYLLLAVCSICILLGAALALRTKMHNPRLSRRLLLTGVLIPIGFYFLQPLIPVFRI
jgi:hypothetical protein